MPVLEGNRVPTRLSDPSPEIASKTSSSRLLVEQENRCRARVKDRPGDLDDRAQELPVALLGSQDAGGDRGSQVISRHRDPIMFVAVR